MRKAVFAAAICVCVVGPLGPVFAQPAFAATPCRTNGSYERWLEDFKKEAAAQGISPRVIGAAAPSMILDTIEKVGPDRKKVIAALADVKDRDSIVGKITFDDHGQNTVPVITKYVVQDGKFVEWDDSEYATGKRKLPGQK